MTHPQTIKETIELIQKVRGILKENDPVYWRDMIDEIGHLESKLEQSLARQSRLGWAQALKSNLPLIIKIVELLKSLIS